MKVSLGQLGRGQTLGAFYFSGQNLLRAVQTMVRTAEQIGAPVVIKISPLTLEMSRVPDLTALRQMAEESTTRVALHLDGVFNLPQSQLALDHGFDSLGLIIGSELRDGDKSVAGFDNLTELVGRMVTSCRDQGLTVEARLRPDFFSRFGRSRLQLVPTPDVQDVVDFARICGVPVLGLDGLIQTICVEENRSLLPAGAQLNFEVPLALAFLRHFRQLLPEQALSIGATPYYYRLTGNAGRAQAVFSDYDEAVSENLQHLRNLVGLVDMVGFDFCSPANTRAVLETLAAAKKSPAQ